jgi:hypothetical protein
MPTKSRQLALPGLPPLRPKKRAHGGDLSKGKRKSKRPLSDKLSLHVVLKSDKAKGYRSLNNNSKTVKSVIRKAAWLFRIKVYSFSLNHNHLHLSVRGKCSVDIQNFFRVLAGHMAQQILRKYPLPQKSGNAPDRDGQRPAGYKRKFWNDLIYSRLVSWGREFRAVGSYIRLNQLEAAGLIRRTDQPIAHANVTRRRQQKLYTDNNESSA